MDRRSPLSQPGLRPAWITFGSVDGHLPRRPMADASGAPHKYHKSGTEWCIDQIHHLNSTVIVLAEYL